MRTYVRTSTAQGRNRRTTRLQDEASINEALKDLNLDDEDFGPNADLSSLIGEESKKGGNMEVDSEEAKMEAPVSRRTVRPTMRQSVQ